MQAGEFSKLVLIEELYFDKNWKLFENWGLVLGKDN